METKVRNAVRECLLWNPGVGLAFLVHYLWQMHKIKCCALIPVLNLMIVSRSVILMNGLFRLYRQQEDGI